MGRAWQVRLPCVTTALPIRRRWGESRTATGPALGARRENPTLTPEGRSTYRSTSIPIFLPRSWLSRCTVGRLAHTQASSPSSRSSTKNPGRRSGSRRPSTGRPTSTSTSLQAHQNHQAHLPPRHRRLLCLRPRRPRTLRLRPAPSSGYLAYPSSHAPTLATCSR